MRLCSVLQRVFGDDEGSWCCQRRRRIDASGAGVKAHRGGDAAIVCSRCRRRIDALVAVDAVGGSMRLVQSSRLAEEETKRLLQASRLTEEETERLFAVVKALGGGDVAVGGCRLMLLYNGSEEAVSWLVRRLGGGCRFA
jgi:hypothetical protein